MVGSCCRFHDGSLLEICKAKGKLHSVISGRGMFPSFIWPFDVCVGDLGSRADSSAAKWSCRWRTSNEANRQPPSFQGGAGSFGSGPRVVAALRHTRLRLGASSGPDRTMKSDSTSKSFGFTGIVLYTCIHRHYRGFYYWGRPAYRKNVQR